MSRPGFAGRTGAAGSCCRWTKHLVRRKALDNTFLLVQDESWIVVWRRRDIFHRREHIDCLWFNQCIISWNFQYICKFGTPAARPYADSTSRSSIRWRYCVKGPSFLPSHCDALFTKGPLIQVQDNGARTWRKYLQNGSLSQPHSTSWGSGLHCDRTREVG